ncbi:hypothetical protein DL98DRAFT_568828 [Cadophora sp. DSE1049]|nr:hypothetical protein DL98DRAFT_568828 [Cadophora sp. DSE1049]
MAEPESSSIPWHAGTDSLNATSLIRARLAESRKRREQSGASLESEVQRMAKKLEENSETIKNLLQMVVKKLSDEGKRSNNEVESSPYGHEQHLEKAVAGSPVSAAGLRTISNTEVEKCNITMADLRSKQFEGSHHITEHHSREAGTVSPEARDLGELPTTQVEDLGCNQEQYPKQARKTCPASSVSAMRPNARLETSQIEQLPKQATIESSTYSKLGKRPGIGAEHPQSNLVQRTKAKIRSSACIQASDETNIAEGINAPQITKNSLPTSTPQQARRPTPAQLQKSTPRITRQRTTSLEGRSARLTRIHKQVAEKQPFDTGIRKRVRDRSDRWLVSEQQILIQLA